MNLLFKNPGVQISLVVAAAVTGFGGIALIGPKHEETVVQPVRLPHAPATDHGASAALVSTGANSTIGEGVPNPAIPETASLPPLPALAPATIASNRSGPAGTHPLTTPVSPTVMVHVAGFVERPAVYSVPANYRVIDVIRLAGGARPGGDTDAVNLAARLQDGEQIYIPPHSAVQSGAVFRQPAPPGRMPLVGPVAAVPRTRISGVRSAPSGGYPPRTQKLTDPSQGIVDLNSAGADELMKLPGIGPSTAAKILDFRKTNGRFTSVEDVMNVKGIGPVKFAKMRPFLAAR